MRAALRRPHRPRRGVTLVEMLVVVALVILMMVILVQIFQSATGAMTASRTTQELDIILRSVDSMLRSDLAGVTAKMTPPNDPALKSGYFEYGENAFADIQGEDTDDYLAFTTKAKEGQVFTGRQFLTPINPAIQPIAITSQTAEVIYFLRNGNLYRRVFLVSPERKKSITTGGFGGGMGYGATFGPLASESWQGMNDISCHPVGFSASGLPTPIPNDLGDLTNRENRAFRPRFSNDFNAVDGIPDDNNGDGINDYYPTLYFDGVGHSITGGGVGASSTDWLPNGQINETLPFPSVGFQRVQTVATGYDVYPFPFIYPGMYSVPDGGSVAANGTVTPPATNLGWHHGLFPANNAAGVALLNHAPLDIGDNLPFPAGKQTWWGFPTWRETMTAYTGSAGWADPVISVNTNTNVHQQPLGLRPIGPASSYPINYGGFLTPLGPTGSSAVPPVASDGAGSASFLATIPQNHLWEDDLILSNVRSFDVKAYDSSAPLYNTPANGFFSAGYQDLGYGAASYLGGWTVNGGNPVAPPFQSLGSDPTGFGHEGRMPPIMNDFRPHPRRGYNIGDNSAGVIRLTRVWDSWSTDYVNAPDTDVLLNQLSPAVRSIYPSFPPPYPSALRGIQIQIRVVDPRNERSKVLTIRHDFTDKLTN